MKLNFHIKRILLFAFCLGAFAAIDGFSPPVIEHGAFQADRIVNKWRYCVIVFMAGACCASFVNHKAGTSEKVDIRIAYILFGALLMALSAYWIYGLKRNFVLNIPGITDATTFEMDQRDVVSSCRNVDPLIEKQICR